MSPKPMHAKAETMAVKKSTQMEPSGEVKPASVKEEGTAMRVGKMRDPFVSPVVRSNGTVGSGCDTGKRCLVVDQIVLKGIVKSPAGFIAVVENPAKRAYFMRENDPVFNGKITKITGDTVVFQEEVKDKVGKQSSREVVKKVNAPIV
jgi:Tfp pilus assembly protein PilP